MEFSSTLQVAGDPTSQARLQLGMHFLVFGRTGRFHKNPEYTGYKPTF